jgi:hypothetical protein
MRYRLSDLALVVAIVASAAGLFVGLGRGQVATGLIGLICLFALPTILAFRPRIGSELCPYCDSWFLAEGASGEVVVCPQCGSRLMRFNGRTLDVLTCPADDRPWAKKFLPKLRRLRVEMRPHE